MVVSEKMARAGYSSKYQKLIDFLVLRDSIKGGGEPGSPQYSALAYSASEPAFYMIAHDLIFPISMGYTHQPWTVGTIE